MWVTVVMVVMEPVVQRERRYLVLRTVALVVLVVIGVMVVLVVVVVRGLRVSRGLPVLLG